MFGYIITNAALLPKDRQERFRAFYCGLCRTLRQAYGLTGSFALSFDMTFLAVLLNALYEPGEEERAERCPPHPLKRHAYIETPVLRYTADMNVALAYHKCLDNWRDDASLPAAAESRLLKKAYDAVRERHPGKCCAILDWLDEIHALEAANDERIDPPVNATGRMLGELFAMDPHDVWEPSLRAVGDGLGRFIYLMDAYDDLDADIRKKRYNPLKSCRGREDYEQMCRDAMTMAVADATREYEMLPIVQDDDILRNILYSGVWSRYAAIQKRREKKERKDAGSL